MIDGGFHMAGKQVDATRQELFITLEYLIDNCYDAEHTSKTIELTQYAQDKYNVLLDRRRANSILEFLADLPNSFPGILSFTVKKIDGKPRYYIENTLFSRYEIKKISEAIFKDERLSAEMAKKYVDKFLSKTCNDKDKAKLLEDFGKKEKRANHSTRKTAERIVKMDELIEEQAAFLFRPRERIKREACSNTRVSFKINSLVRRAKNPRYDEQSYIEAIGYTQAKGNDVCLYIPEYEGAIIIDINNIKIKPGSLLSYRRRGESFELADSQYSSIDEMIDLYYEGGTGLQLDIRFKYVVGFKDNIENQTIEKLKRDYEDFFSKPFEYTFEERVSTHEFPDGTTISSTLIDLHSSIRCNYSSFKKWYWEHGWFEHLVVVEPKMLNNKLLGEYIARFQTRLERYGETPEEKEERLAMMREERERRFARWRAARANRENNDGGN